MKRKDLADNEKLDILKRLIETPRPSQEVVAEETHHRKAKIGAVPEEFRAMAWEKAQAFCNNDQHILSLRDDYVERKIAEAKDYEETIKSIPSTLKHDLGLPPFPVTHTYMKNGHWVMEF
jgi:hypothetical protein